MKWNYKFRYLTGIESQKVYEWNSVFRMTSGNMDGRYPNFRMVSDHMDERNPNLPMTSGHVTGHDPKFRITSGHMSEHDPNFRKASGHIPERDPKFRMTSGHIMERYLFARLVVHPVTCLILSEEEETVTWLIRINNYNSLFAIE